MFYSLERFIAHSTRPWTLVLLAASIGIVTGFSVPLAASHQGQKFYQPAVEQAAKSTVLASTCRNWDTETLAGARGSVTDSEPAPDDRDNEIARLEARNRYLEAVIAKLRAKSLPAGEQPDD